LISLAYHLSGDSSVAFRIGANGDRFELVDDENRRAGEEITAEPW
jgi:hypothetical protein